MMGQWKTCTLGGCISLVIDHRGLTPKKLGGEWAPSGHRAVSAKNIKNGHLINVESMHLVDENMYRRWMTEEVMYGDILITSEAPFGETLYWNSDEKIVASQRVFVLRPSKERCDGRYLYYWMRSPRFQAELAGRATGTTVMGLRQPELLKCSVQLPSLDTQKRIASLLASFDDKIALNARINAGLEAQAEALYAEMIRNRADVSTGILSDIADVTMGQSPDGSSYNESGKGEVFFQGRAEFGSRFPARRLYTTSPKRMACENDVLMSVRAPVGDINVAYEDCCIGRGLAAIHSKNGHQSFVLYTMRALRDQLDVFNGEGTVFGSINGKALNSLSISLPSADSIDRFEEVVAPMDAAIRNNYAESTQLQVLRDALLPRLTSGEIDVSNAEV